MLNESEVFIFMIYKKLSFHVVIVINLKAEKHEIEDLKAEIQEVLQFIKKTKRTIEKLQKQYKVRLFEGTEEHSGLETVNTNEIQIICVEFDNNISWGALENLTENKYNTLSDNDKSFVKLVKSLFFPEAVSINDVLIDKSDIKDWKEHIRNLRLIIETKKGIPFGEYLFKDNLKFSEVIYDSYEKNRLFGKDYDEDYKQNVTRDFFDKYGLDIINNVEARYGLFYEEARIFTLYLACMADFDKTVLGFDYGSMHEFFQNVWIKINSNQDEFRKKQLAPNNDIKQIVHSNFSRFKTSVSTGFDSYFVLLNQSKFELWFSEQKCGRGHSICKNYKNITDLLHKSIFNLANKRTNKRFQDLLQKSGFDILQIIDFVSVLFKRYTYYYDALGNDFLVKMKVQKYTHDLIFGLERNGYPNAKQLARKLIEAAKDNHRLIALIQNGFTLDDNEKVVNFLDLIDRNKQSIRIFGEIFTFKPMKNKKGEYIVSIKGYSESLLKKIKRTNPKFDPEPYEKLNTIFQSISQERNSKIEGILRTSDYIETLLSSYNGLLYEIFNYLTNCENFASFEKLKNGRTFVCSEVASEEISAVREWFERNQRLYSAIPYTTNYFWKLPFFGKLREISKNDNLKMSKTKELAFKRLFSHNDKEVLSFLEDLKSSNFSEEDYKKRAVTNPEYSFLFGFLYLLKGNTWLKLRKNLFEQGDTLRALVFLDEEEKPIRIFGEDKELSSMENPFLNIRIDFSEIFSVNRLLDRNILSTFPIAIKSGKSQKRYPELKFRFCRADGRSAGEKGKKAREMYIERIREKLGHIEEINDVIDVLYSKPAISFNLLRGENRETMMKLFIYLLLEYDGVWKDFSKSLIEYLDDNVPFRISNLVLSNSFVNAGWNITLNSIAVNSNGKWLIHYEVSKESGKFFNRKIEVLPAFVNISNKNSNKEKLGHIKELTLFCNYNRLYLSILSILEKEIMPLVLMNNEKKSASKMSNKWKDNIDWMEKACV